MNDIDDLVRRSRPEPQRGWARSADGQRVLAEVLAGAASGSVKPAASWLRRLRPVLFAGVGVAMLAGTAAAAVVVLAPEPPSTWTVPGNSIACAAERRADADLTIYQWTPGVDPADTCRKHWTGTVGKAPTRLFSCVYRKEGGGGGGVVVIPGDGYQSGAEACATVDMYVAPPNLTPDPAEPNRPSPPSRQPASTPVSPEGAADPSVTVSAR